MADKHWEGGVCWRGTVGVIKPTYRAGSIEDLIRLLPRGIGVTTLHLDMRNGTREQFTNSIPAYEEKVAFLAELGVELIHPAGAPPFFLLGYRGETELLARWERDSGVPVFTNGTTQVNALQAFSARRMIGFSYFRGEMNRTFGDYFREAGFDVADMLGYDVDFDKVQTVAGHQVYRWIKQEFRKHRGLDAVYMLGPGWLQTLDIVDMLEQDLGVPVVHHIPAQSWEIQRRLLVCQPVEGYGRLLRQMPPLAEPPPSGTFAKTPKTG
jgi:maleate cis-trans isomerase